MISPFKMRQIYRRILIALIILIAIPATAFATLTRVEIGTKYVCKYGKQVVRSNTREITVFRWNADQYKVNKIKTVCARHKRLEALYRKAREALKNGDLAQAKKLFEEIKRVDPEFRDIQTQLSQIASQEGGTSSGGTAGGGTPGGSSPGGGAPGGGSPGGGERGGGSPGDGTSPSIDPVSLLPASLAGYSTGTVESGADYAKCSYLPSDTTRVQSLLITVRVLASFTEAQGFVDRVDRVAFPLDAQDTTVNGYAAYFGTDGRTYATLAWAKDRVVYELTMHSATGNPAELFSDITTLADSLE